MGSELYTRPFACPAKIRVSATKPSTGISSARAVGSIAAAASSAPTSTPSDLRLWRSILRRCPNAASVSFCKAPASQEFGALKTFGQLLANGLLDDARAGKADEGAGFGDVQIAQHGETGGDAAGGGVGEHAHKGQAGLVEAHEGGGDFGHLHEADGAFLHA